MRYRKLGRTGLEVSELGYGAWGIGGTQWLGVEDKMSMLSLRAAIEGGVNFIDTALAYGDGHSEKLIGQVLSDVAHTVYVATKVPPKNRLWPAREGVAIDDVFPYDYVMESTEASLRNLNRSSVDLQQFHVWNPAWINDDQWRRAIEDIKRQGKARFVGISINDHQPDSALEIIKTGLIDTVQVIYNIFDQTAERNLFPLCQENNIGVIVRVPFDEGALTGRINAETSFHPGEFREHYFRGDRKAQVESRVDSLLNDLDIEASGLPSVALRFVLSHPAVATVIPGMRSRASVDDNLSAPMLGPLPSNTLEVLRRHAWDKNWYD